MASEPGPMGWRVGRSLGRTIYRDNEFMGIMETAVLARAVVAMLQEAGPQRVLEMYAAVSLRPRGVSEGHRYIGSNGIFDLCACGKQWLVQAERCVTQGVKL